MTLRYKRFTAEQFGGISQQRQGIVNMAVVKFRSAFVESSSAKFFITGQMHLNSGAKLHAKVAHIARSPLLTTSCVIPLHFSMRMKRALPFSAAT